MLLKLQNELNGCLSCKITFKIRGRCELSAQYQTTVYMEMLGVLTCYGSPQAGDQCLNECAEPVEKEG